MLNAPKLSIKDDSQEGAKVNFSIDAEATEKKKGSVINVGHSGLFNYLIFSYFRPILKTYTYAYPTKSSPILVLSS